MEEIFIKYEEKWRVPAQVIQDFFIVRKIISPGRTKRYFARAGYKVSVRQIKALQQCLRREKRRTLTREDAFR